MTYDPSRMSLLGPASGGMLWSYFSQADGKATVSVPAYFVPIWQQLDPGDRIHCHCGGVFFDIAVMGVNSGAVTTVASANYT